MQSRRIARHPIALLGVVALFAAGCIVSGQFTIVINIDDEIATVDNGFNVEKIDLTKDDTWKKHKDDIQNIIDVKFKMTIVNNSGDSVTGEIYVSETKYTSAQVVQDSATRVISGIIVAPDDSPREISFAESAKYITDLKTLLDLVEKGQFYVYGLTTESPFTITIESGARLLITFSAG